jgi:hypothetical protein
VNRYFELAGVSGILFGRTSNGRLNIFFGGYAVDIYPEMEFSRRPDGLVRNHPVQEYSMPDAKTARLINKLGKSVEAKIAEGDYRYGSLIPGSNEEKDQYLRHLLKEKYGKKVSAYGIYPHIAAHEWVSAYLWLQLSEKYLNGTSQRRFAEEFAKQLK